MPCPAVILSFNPSTQAEGEAEEEAGSSDGQHEGNAVSEQNVIRSDQLVSE